MRNLKTEAYLPFSSNQDWTSDPEFAVIMIDENLVNLVLRGINALKESGFDTITSTRVSPTYDFIAEKDSDDGYEKFEPEYSVIAPDVVISSHDVQFAFDFKHTSEQGWCELSFEQLAGYMDKAWVESYGNVFVQLPDTDDDGDGKWLCIDPNCPDGFCVERDTLWECVEVSASVLEDTVDETMEGAVLRPKLDPLRSAERQDRLIGNAGESESVSTKSRSCRP